MADAAAASDAVVDDAWSAADGTRKAARWMASAFGAIPSIAIVGAIVRNPGEGGFDEAKLAWGVALAALGAVLGILGFARVFSPVPLSDRSLLGFDMTRVDGNPFDSYQELTTVIDAYGSAIAEDENEVLAAERVAKFAEVALAAKLAEQKELEAALKAAPNDSSLKQKLADAEAATEAAKAANLAAAAASISAVRGASAWSTQFDRLTALRKQAYQLKASDEVADRYLLARWLAFFAVAFVAAGLVLVGLAPKPKATPAAPPSLVKLELNEAGQTAIGCKTSTLYGLRVGGTDAVPKVITFATDDCAPKTVDFKKSEKPSFGDVTPVKAIPPSE